MALNPAQRRRNQRARHHRVELEHRGWAGGHERPLDIRAGDTVEVIAGKDRGRRATVQRTMPEKQRIVVDGVNILKRHTKSGVKGNVQGGIIDFAAPLHYSNVMLVCNRCDRTTRIGRMRRDDGTSIIVCKRCGEPYERVRK